MKPLDEQERIDDLRKRLYSRGEQFNSIERHTVSDVQVDVSRDWNTPKPDAELSLKPKRRYRLYILLFSMLIFLTTAGITGFYIYSGGNAISSENINLNITAPHTLGGGEVMQAQVGITNQNNVAIESATLIVSYPAGSQTVTEPTENLYEKRFPVGTLESGEVKNVAIDAVIYGEEGDEQQLKATLEYSVAGSDGMFYKDATPHTIRIVTSPVSLEVTSVRQIASGQEVEIDVRITSNSSQTYEKLLVTMSYPAAFSFAGAEPQPAYNENVWQIDSLKPEESRTISLRGTITGLADERPRISVSIGPAQPNNQFIVGATLARSYTEFLIERPFIDVTLSVDGDTTGPVILPAGEPAAVAINVHNTLNQTVYDMAVGAELTGGALDSATVDATRGSYDSNSGKVQFVSPDVEDLAEVRADQTVELAFIVRPGQIQSTDSFTVAVNVYGRRVGEANAQEQLFGTTEIEVRYQSDVDLANNISHVSGPIPPKVGETTTYQVKLTAKAGANEVTQGVLKTSLPTYVSWLDNYAGKGTVTFNPVSRELTWEVGDIAGGREEALIFMVGLLPTDSQAGITPVLVRNQEFTARDRFTNTALNTTGQQLTTELAEDEEGNGVVAN